MSSVTVNSRVIPKTDAVRANTNQSANNAVNRTDAVCGYNDSILITINTSVN